MKKYSVFLSLTVGLLLSLTTFAVPAQKKKDAFWRRLLRFAGISATPSTQKGPSDERQTGDIWVVNLGKDAPVRLTQDGGYRSPIFISRDRTILALKGDTVVEIPVGGGSARPVFSLKGAAKFVGLSLDNPDSVLMLMEGQNTGRSSLAFLSLKARKITAADGDPESSEFRDMVAHAESWERVYGDTILYVKAEKKDDLAGTLEWTDVFLRTANKAPVNLSQCDGVNCGQPSLSRKRDLVVYVRSEE